MELRNAENRKVRRDDVFRRQPYGAFRKIRVDRFEVGLSLIALECERHSRQIGFQRHIEIELSCHAIRSDRARLVGQRSVAEIGRKDDSCGLATRQGKSADEIGEARCRVAFKRVAKRCSDLEQPRELQPGARVADIDTGIAHRCVYSDARAGDHDTGELEGCPARVAVIGKSAGCRLSPDAGDRGGEHRFRAFYVLRRQGKRVALCAQVTNDMAGRQQVEPVRANLAAQSGTCQLEAGIETGDRPGI